MALITFGHQEMYGFVARAQDYGERAFEDKLDAIAEAMSAPGKGQRKWFEEQGIEVE